MSTLKIQKLSKDIIIPTKDNANSGYDIYADPKCSLYVLKPGDIQIIPTGFKMEIPEGYTFLIKERGSTGSKALSIRAGVVDSNFRGEVKVMINNTSSAPILIGRQDMYDILAGQAIDQILQDYNAIHAEQLELTDLIFYPITKAIAQGIIIKNENWETEEVDHLSNTERGEGMLGSTNK